MKLFEAIRRIDNLKHNTYSSGEKIEWLSQLDGSTYETVHKTHKGGVEAFNGYNENTPEDTELLIPAPYDSVYLFWLEAQIDYYNGEYGKYNNSASRYTRAYQEYIDFYHRTHKPLPEKTGFF